jgi:hypothetical protein
MMKKQAEEVGIRPEIRIESDLRKLSLWIYVYSSEWVERVMLHVEREEQHRCLAEGQSLISLYLE